jgi:hypothetical protein
MAGSLRLLAGHKTGILHDHDFGGFDQRSNGLALLRRADYESVGNYCFSLKIDKSRPIMVP